MYVTILLICLILSGFLGWLGYTAVRSRRKARIWYSFIFLALAEIAALKWFVGQVGAGVNPDAVWWVWRMWCVYPLIIMVICIVIAVIRNGSEVLHES